MVVRGPGDVKAGETLRTAATGSSARCRCCGTRADVETGSPAPRDDERPADETAGERSRKDAPRSVNTDRRPDHLIRAPVVPDLHLPWREPDDFAEPCELLPRHGLS